LTSLGRYLYAQRGDEVAVHLYVGSTASFEIAGRPVVLIQETDYPWDGQVRVRLQLDRPTTFTLALRVPGWCPDASLQVAGEEVPLDRLDRGYAVVRREWRDGEEVVLTLPLTPQRTYAHPRVTADVGRVALLRGPLVYCLEGVDHDEPLDALALPPGTDLSPDAESTLPGITVLRGSGVRLIEDADLALYRTYRPAAPAPLTAVPYYAWDNRAPGEMQVWLRESERAG
jgi:DUF1680 family protein